MRRRPMLPDVRRDVALRPTPVRTFDGRVEALPAGIVGATANPSKYALAVQQTVVHRVTAVGKPSQDIADGDSDLVFVAAAGPPRERNGFTQFVTTLGSDGETSEIVCEVTGDLEVSVTGSWGDYPDGHRGSGTFTITRTRGAQVDTVTTELEPPARDFDGHQITWSVKAEDVLTFTMPNRSGEVQALAEVEVGVRIIAPGQVLGDDPPPGPAVVGDIWYPLEETSGATADNAWSSDGTDDGVYSGGVVLGADGVNGKAAQVSGGAYIGAPTARDTDVKTWSVGFFFNADSWANDMRLIGSLNIGNNIRLRYNGGNIEYLGDGFSGGWFVFGAAPATGEWHHLMFVQTDGGGSGTGSWGPNAKHELYLDGVAYPNVKTNGEPRTPWDHPDENAFTNFGGKGQVTQGLGFEGRYDDIMIFLGTALTADEVAALYASLT